MFQMLLWLVNVVRNISVVLSAIAVTTLCVRDGYRRYAKYNV